VASQQANWLRDLLLLLFLLLPLPLVLVLLMMMMLVLFLLVVLWPDDSCHSRSSYATWPPARVGRTTTAPAVI
jgi:hypothetical protein